VTGIQPIEYGGVLYQNNTPTIGAGLLWAPDEVT